LNPNLWIQREEGMTMKKRTLIIILSIAFAVPLIVESTESARIPDRIQREENPLAAVRLGPPPAAPRATPPAFVSCDISRDNCGSITPNPSTYWIADGDHNCTDGTVFFVDVPDGDGVFQLDPATCEVIAGTYYSVNDGVSQRGIGYDAEHHQIWVGGWNDMYLNQRDADPPYTAISYNYTGLLIASIAVDDANNYLFIGTNSYPDYLYVYDITGGVLGSLLGTWEVPWQSYSDGYDAAGMGFDDGMGQLVMVNQAGSYSGSVREIFDFSIDEGLTGASWCDLANTSFGWGIAVVADEDTIPGSAYSYVTDIGDFEAPIDIDEYGVPTVYAPYDFRCYGEETCDITITWTNGEEYDSVNVYDREFHLIAVLPGEATSFTVDNVYFNICDGPDYPEYFVSGVVGSEESGRVGGCGWMWYPSWDGFDFDYGPMGFVPGGNAEWEWGVPSPPVNGHAWETALGGNYPDGACGWLDSPFMMAGGCGQCLDMLLYHDVECEGDGWNLQISTDGGTTWSVIHPYEGYDQGEPAGSCETGLGDSTFCGQFGVSCKAFDLDAYHGQAVRFRFLFESDMEGSAAGLILKMVGFPSQGYIPSMGLQCEVLNPDNDGDGLPDVHLGESLFYRATFMSQEPQSQEYGISHSLYGGETCPPDSEPVVSVGPYCLGSLPGWGMETHYYRVRVPTDSGLLTQNPWAVDLGLWACNNGIPRWQAGQCCFNVALLPQRKPPPVPVPMDEFVIEEIQELPE
jgi:hypothetical protein